MERILFALGLAGVYWLAKKLRAPIFVQRILLTVTLLAVYRLGMPFPTPGIDQERLGWFLGYLPWHYRLIDILSGGTFRRLTIFALGLVPYIAASIIVQFVTVAVPALRRRWKDGGAGRGKIVQWTHGLSIVLSALWSFAIAASLQAVGVVLHAGTTFILVTVFTLSAGSVIVVWLADRISRRGIGYGIPLIILTGVVPGLPLGDPSLTAATLAVLALTVQLERSISRRPAPGAARAGAERRQPVS